MRGITPCVQLVLLALALAAGSASASSGLSELCELVPGFTYQDRCPFEPPLAFSPAVLAGTAGGAAVIGAETGLASTDIPLVPLEIGPHDGEGIPEGLSIRLTVYQEAIIGCGLFFGVDCDSSGVDPISSEWNALLQSFPGADTTSLCRRFHFDGTTQQFPGCRGPDDPDYDPVLDGGEQRLYNPATGAVFRSEIAALSWNFLTAVVAFSNETRAGARDGFDAMASLRSDGCSFARPRLCSTVRALVPVPEPGSLALLGCSGLALAARRRFAAPPRRSDLDQRASPPIRFLGGWRSSRWGRACRSAQLKR